jgi:hypothetical protein
MPFKKGHVPWNKDKTGVYSEETRQSMGAKNIGRKQTEEQKRALRIGQERKPTEAEIEKIRIANTGQKRTEEQIENIRKSVNEGFENGREVWNKDKKMSPEYCRTVSDAVKKYYADGGEPWNKDKIGVISEEQKRAISEANTGREHTEEEIEKIRIARRHQKFPPEDNKFETWWFQRFKEEGMEFEEHKPILGIPDIFIPPNKCIFLDGDRHHANPSKYSDDAIIWPSTGETAKTIRERNEKIRQELITDGYEIIPVWWSDWKKDPEKCFQKIIKIIKEARK